VAEFDAEIVKKAILINRPTQLALQFLNYLYPLDEGKTSWDALSADAKEYIDHLERAFGVPVTLIGTGQSNEAMIDRRRTP
jgi:adenylosuccinate synthase